MSLSVIEKRSIDVFRFKVLPCLSVMLLLLLPSAKAEMKHSDNHMDMHAKMMGMLNQQEDSRELVRYPKPMYDMTLSNMREHLRAIHLVQQLVAQGRYTEAAEASEKGLGMGNNHGTEGHGMEHQFMPEGMKTLGSQMHKRSADLALTLRDAEITDDLKAIFTSLSQVTSNCVACHDAYRLEPMQ